MHLFVSAGEPSGDLHGANLIRAIHARNPDLRVVALGGEHMAEAGAQLRYPLTELAVMWIGRAMLHLPTFFRLARQTEVYFRSQRPAAVILIDYPGFHWALAKRAHRAGIPVFYFVPPQLWAWAGWRVSKMRRWVDTVMTALPFEQTWYSERGVRTHYVGHPYFDELTEQKLDQEFVTKLRSEEGPLVALLPGSRNQEVQGNLPLMLAAAGEIRQAVPQARFVIASYKEKQARTAAEFLAKSGLKADIHIKRTPEIIEAADAAIAVSGSVGLELMTRLTPTVVVYKITPFARWVSKQFMTCKYISLVNLLAEEELFPEFLTMEWEPGKIAAPVIDWLRNPASREASVAKLKALRDRVAIPGACDRAAEFIVNQVAIKQKK